MAWKGTRKEFINEFGAYVHKVTNGTGILPGTLIAQLFLESSSKGVVGASKLSQDANNYFGIKCGGGWDGPKYYIETREVLNGRSVMVPACFRAYGSIKDSIQDYVLFLQENPRYKNAGVFEAKTVKEQAQALKRAGYATAPAYADLVFNVYKPYAQLIEDQKTLMAGFSIKKTLGVVLLASAATIIYNKLFKK
jgi:mannosyl-glycoprotein endo-beta-N-acetylglucosaminidase/stage II sporulation protein P